MPGIAYAQCRAFLMPYEPQNLAAVLTPRWST